MNIAEAINKARQKGMNDAQILQKLRKQNPDKEAFFRKAEGRGATATQILEEIAGQSRDSAFQKDPEEEMRKDFLKRVEGKTHGENARSKEGAYMPPPPGSEAPRYSPPPSFSKSTEKEKGNKFGAAMDAVKFPQQGMEDTRLWTRIIIILFVITLASFSLASLFRAIKQQPDIEPLEPKTIEKEFTTPVANPSFLPLRPYRDDIKRGEFRTADQFRIKLLKYLEEERGGEFVRIIMEDQRDRNNPDIFKLEYFFRAIGISFANDPEEDDYLWKLLDEEYFTLLFYTRENGSKLGFMARRKQDKDDTIWWMKRYWPPEKMLANFSGLYDFLELKRPDRTKGLGTIPYKGTDIHYQEIPAAREEIFLATENNHIVYQVTPTECLERVERIEPISRKEYKLLDKIQGEEENWYKVLIDDKERWVRGSHTHPELINRFEEDYGFYYAIREDYFIFTTSLESMRAIIDRL